MDMMMLVVTCVSLVVAAVAAAVAWRAVHAEHQRSAARVAALAAAAKALPDLNPPPTPMTVPDVIGLDEFLALPPSPVRHDVRLADEPVPVSSHFTGSPAASAADGRQHWLMGAAAVFAAVVIAFAGIGFFGSRAVRSVAATDSVPLELVALSHSRVDGALAVAGLVRNPPAGVQVKDLQAEVRVFDAAGILISTRSTLIETASLAPGQDASFAVRLGELVTAARYRVSFHAAGTMLPHVDRRTNQPAAVTADAR